MSSISPLRCVGINEAILADDGTAVLFELIMDSGQIFPLELDSEGLELLSRVVLAGTQVLANAVASAVSGGGKP